MILAGNGTISGMFGDMFAATVPVPIVVILFMAALAVFAVKK